LPDTRQTDNLAVAGFHSHEALSRSVQVAAAFLYPTTADQALVIWRQRLAAAGTAPSALLYSLVWPTARAVFPRSVAPRSSPRVTNTDPGSIANRAARAAIFGDQIACKETPGTAAAACRRPPCILAARCQSIAG